MLILVDVLLDNEMIASFFLFSFILKPQMGVSSSAFIFLFYFFSTNQRWISHLLLFLFFIFFLQKPCLCEGDTKDEKLAG